MKRVESTKVHNNKWGFRGVEYRKRKSKPFCAVICGKNKRGRYLGSYNSPEEAALAYDEAAIEEYGDEAYLNFPLHEEKKTVKSRLQEGFCPKGHELKDHGKVNSKGDTICKRCQADASNRYYKKKITPPPPKEK